MSLYFETKVQFNESGTISTLCVWHPTAPLLAVGSYSQEKGGFVTIFDELGEPLPDISYPVHPVSQITSLAWHPDKRILVTGWENGEISVWHGSNAARGFVNVNGPHTSPVTLLVFSEMGGRLASGDATGILVGWKYDASTTSYLTSFHHDLKQPLTHIVFRLSVLSRSSSELQHLARAAVNGDESALDALSSWRPRTNATRTQAAPRTKDNACYYVATQAGWLYYVNQSGTCTEVTNTESTLHYVMYHPERNELIVMTENLTLEHYAVDSGGTLAELSRIKLSGRTQALRGASSQGLVWCGGTSFAVLTGDMTVRVLDLESGDNYLLPSAEENNSPLSARDNTTAANNNIHSNTELFTGIAYCKHNRALVAGTNIGQLHIWSCRNQLNASSPSTARNYQQDNYQPEANWTLDNISAIKGTVKEILWGDATLRNPYICVNCVTNVFILKKQALCSHYSDELWAVQLGSTQLLLQDGQGGKAVQNYEIQVTVLCLNSKYVVISNGRVVIIYQVFSTSNHQGKPSLEFKVAGNFTCETERLLVHEQTIIALMPQSVQFRSISGVILNTIKNSDNEGEPIGIELTDKFLCLFTMNGYLKIYDVSKHEPKLLTSPAKYLGEDINDFGEVIYAKCNNLGTLVAMLIANTQLIPDGKLYLWNIETDAVFSYDFGDEMCLDNIITISDSLHSDYDAVKNRTLPVKFFWDSKDWRLLAVESRVFVAAATTEQHQQGIDEGLKSKGVEKAREDDTWITCMFATEGGLNVMYRCGCNESTGGYLIGLSAPHIVMHGSRSVQRILLKHFIGLEDCDDKVRTAVLDFAYYLCLGNMDQAYKSISQVRSTAIWENLARMCVRTRRLDVALVCLGHTGNARAARAVRRAMTDVGGVEQPEEAKAAALAIQLGLLNEAKSLYEKCQRWDLLNKFYQAQGKYDEALQLAEREDRIHLKNTYYHCGRERERAGDVPKAVEMYTKANCKSEIPRLLMVHPLALQDFMEQTDDQDMLRWWAQYIESRGDVERALEVYAKANDCVSQVRVLCFMRLESRAADVARSSDSKAACYELARHYEAIENMDEAIQFFRRAQAYGMAIRICREQGMDDVLWTIASSAGAGGPHRVEAAEYFESLGDTPKAVTLYHRAGLLRKALELAFGSQQSDVLQDIAADFDESSDPELIAECAEYFAGIEQYERAVGLLTIANKYTEALDICHEHAVNVNEELAERLSPAKGSMDERERSALLYRLAEILHGQGDYHLATKKFTQAGDKIRAMKSLLKSGDTDKIVFFAGVSRQREVYVMAANYLQALDWQNDPDILRHIVAFYAKGKAHDLLANFYVACAQVEIDEYRNYDKALSALGEAARCLAKVEHDARAMEALAYRQSLVKRYLECHRTIQRDVSAGLMQCGQLLRVSDAESPVRRCDVLSMMVEQGLKPGGDRDAALQALQEMHKLLDDRSVISRQIPGEVYEKLGVSPPKPRHNQDHHEEEEEEEVEDISEAI